MLLLFIIFCRSLFVMLQVTATRKLLLQLCGFKGRISPKHSKEATGLKAMQLRQLQLTLVAEGHSGYCRKACQSRRCARGTLQEPRGKVQGHKTLQDIIREIGGGCLDIRQPASASHLMWIQNHMPVMAAFLTKLEGELPQYTSLLLLDILDCISMINALFGKDERTYSPPRTDKHMDIFPCLPIRRANQILWGSSDFMQSVTSLPERNHGDTIPSHWVFLWYIAPTESVLVSQY